MIDPQTIFYDIKWEEYLKLNFIADFYCFAVYKRNKYVLQMGKLGGNHIFPSVMVQKSSGIFNQFT